MRGRGRGRRAILLIFGLSGVGKSTAARTIVRKHGFRHINLDLCDKEGEFDPELERAWGRLYAIWDPQKFQDLMLARLDEGSWPGAVVTFAPVWLAKAGQLPLLAERGFTCVVLTGDTDLIRRSMVRREGGRGLRGVVELWNQTNRKVLEMLEDTGYDPYRVDVFAGTERRPAEAVAAELISRLP